MDINLIVINTTDPSQHAVISDISILKALVPRQHCPILPGIKINCLLLKTGRWDQNYMNRTWASREAHICPAGGDGDCIISQKGQYHIKRYCTCGHIFSFTEYRWGLCMRLSFYRFMNAYSGVPNSQTRLPIYAVQKRCRAFFYLSQ